MEGRPCFQSERCLMCTALVAMVTKGGRNRAAVLFQHTFAKCIFLFVCFGCVVFVVVLFFPACSTVSFTLCNMCKKRRKGWTLLWL